MKTRVLILFVIFLIGNSCYTSCVRDVVLDAGEKPQVVVECIVSNDTIQKLYLSFTKGASRDEAMPLTEAVATLIDLTESRTVGQFVKGEEENLWTLEYSAIQDHRYRLEVQVPGYDLIWAEDTMPRQIDVREYPETYYEWVQSGKDPEDYIPQETPDKYASQWVGSYYKFCEDFTSPLWIYGIDMEFEDWHLRTGPIAGEIFTDLQNVDNFNMTGQTYLPEITDRLHSYGPFVTGIRTYYPDLKGAMKHDRFLRVNSGRCDEIFLLGCNFLFFPNYGYPRPMMFMSVSEVYDNYLIESFKINEVKKSSDMSSIFLRDNPSSNIHGGIGVFGCKVQWDLDCMWTTTYVPVDEYSKYGIDPETHKYIEN